MNPDSKCFHCPEDPCFEVITPVCEDKHKNCCDDSFPSSCVFTTERLMCSNGKFYVEANISISEVIKQIICKINELEAKIIRIETDCCPVTNCELPIILSPN
jgi:hypothetical protein